MLKKILTVFILAMGLSASACWFTAVNYDKCYIARINTLNTYMTGETFQVYRVSGAGATDANGDYYGNVFPGMDLRKDRAIFKKSTAPEGWLAYAAYDQDYWIWFTYLNDIMPLYSKPATSNIPPEGTYDGSYTNWGEWIFPFPTVTKIDDDAPAPSWDFNRTLPAGLQDLPCQVWVKIAPREAESPYNAPAPIHEALLQYKKLPSGTWTTFKDLHAINWTMDFSKPVQLFGPNIFDPPGAVANDKYLVRLYFTDGVYENALLSENPPEFGTGTTWKNQWITKITISGKRRPQ